MILENNRTITEIIAQNVRLLRAKRARSLDALAVDCGISRSMISRIERGESSATAVVLEKLATGLGVPLANLFHGPERSGDPVSRAAHQVQWRDPASGYLRRHISPIGVASPVQIIEVYFPARAKVAYESGERSARVDQQIWVLEGSIDVTLADRLHHLECGDCLAMVLDRPVMFSNPTEAPARYAVILTDAQSGA